MDAQFAVRVHSFTDDIISMIFSEFKGKTSGEEGFTKDDVMKNLFDNKQDEIVDGVNIEEEEIKEDDHEVGMGLSSLKSSVRSAKIIYTNIKKRNIEDLDGWVQEKMTLAADYLKNVADYMEDLEEYDKDGTNTK